MKRTTELTSIVAGAALALSLAPGAALAYDGDFDGSRLVVGVFAPATQDAGEEDAPEAESLADLVLASAEVQAGAVEEEQRAAEEQARIEAEEKVTKVLSYDPAALEAIGSQQSTGHRGCCPSFSCAYADAVIDGTIHDHSYYTCSCCTWTDWGGGGSSFRCVGSDEELLREAYDQIAAGKPTVIHVRASYGQHWIALIGYQDATDPDHLELSNFIALDPWDGSQVNAGDSFELYGDGCEHISDR